MDECIQLSIWVRVMQTLPRMKDNLNFSWAIAFKFIIIESIRVKYNIILMMNTTGQSIHFNKNWGKSSPSAISFVLEMDENDSVL